MMGCSIGINEGRVLNDSEHMYVSRIALWSALHSMNDCGLHSIEVSLTSGSLWKAAEDEIEGKEFPNPRLKKGKSSTLFGSVDD
jgi:hypothetical protein